MWCHLLVVYIHYRGDQIVSPCLLKLHFLFFFLNERDLIVFYTKLKKAEFATLHCKKWTLKLFTKKF